MRFRRSSIGTRPHVPSAKFPASPHAMRPVETWGDVPMRNGLALTGTLNWMFDCGLISVAGDCDTHPRFSQQVPL